MGFRKIFRQALTERWRQKNNDQWGRLARKDKDSLQKATKGTKGCRNCSRAPKRRRGRQNLNALTKRWRQKDGNRGANADKERQSSKGSVHPCLRGSMAS